MKVLSVRQPWAHAIVSGEKDVENRTRNVVGAWRGPIAIHAGLTIDAGASSTPQRGLLEEIRRRDHPTLIVGAILGVVNVIEVHLAQSCRNRGGSGLCSPWAQDGTVHIVLADARMLADPIPYRGALGLRELDLDTTLRIKKGLSA